MPPPARFGARRRCRLLRPKHGGSSGAAPDQQVSRVVHQVVFRILLRFAQQHRAGGGAVARPRRVSAPAFCMPRCARTADVTRRSGATSPPSSGTRFASCSRLRLRWHHTKIGQRDGRASGAATRHPTAPSRMATSTVDARNNGAPSCYKRIRVSGDQAAGHPDHDPPRGRRATLTRRMNAEMVTGTSPMESPHPERGCGWAMEPLPP